MSKLCDFLEAELENRQSAGGDETDYVNEAREALAELAALTAERDAAILRAKSAEQDWANREADTLRLTVLQEDCQRALADALAHASREASLRIKTESYFLGKTATLETERDALRAQLQTAREAFSAINAMLSENGTFDDCIRTKMIAADIARAALAAIKKEPQP